MLTAKLFKCFRSSLVYPVRETVRALSSASTVDLGGIFPPITIPFNREEEIDMTSLEKNVKKWNEIPFKGLVVLGSNSEYTFMTADEKVSLVKRARSLVPADRLVIGGSGCESTRHTIELSRALADAGADALLVVTPCYYKNAMTSDALARHYIKVADSSPVPIILYSVPAFTTIDLAASTIISLARHPNIIGLKESSTNVAKIGQIVHETRNENFQVLAGSASYILQSHVVGSVGAVCALANVMGEEVCRLHQLCQSGDIAAASELQKKLITPNAAVTSRFGIPGLKFAMEQFGYVGGIPRSPLIALSEEKQQLLLEDFKQDGFLK